MQLASLLSLTGLCGLVLGQQTSAADVATVIIEQQNPNLVGNLVNSTVQVPIDLLAQSPVTIVDPKLLSRFYLLAPQVSCTPLFDTVPATPFPTIVGPSFTSKSSAAPPQSANDLNQAKLRFSCTKKLSGITATRPDRPPYADVSLEKFDPMNGTSWNESHVLNIGVAGQSSFPTKLPSDSVVGFILTYVNGVEPTTVTCTPVWTTVNGYVLGRPFGIDGSSGRPTGQQDFVGPNIDLTCTSPETSGLATDNRAHARDFTKPAADIEAVSKNAVILRGTALSDQVQGPNYTYNIPVGQPSVILSVGLSELYLASTSVVDVNAVTCTPVWTQGSSNATGPDFSFTVSSYSPVFVSNQAPANVTIFCKDHLEVGTAVGVKASALSGQPAARDVLRPRTVPPEYDLSKCPPADGPPGETHFCQILDPDVTYYYALNFNVVGQIHSDGSAHQFGPGHSDYSYSYPLVFPVTGEQYGDVLFGIYYRDSPDCSEDINDDWRMPGDTIINTFYGIIENCPKSHDMKMPGGYAIDGCFLWVLKPTLDQPDSRSTRETSVSGQPAAQDVLQTRTIPLEYDLSKCSASTGPIGKPSVCDCWDLGLEGWLEDFEETGWEGVKTISDHEFGPDASDFTVSLPIPRDHYDYEGHDGEVFIGVYYRGGSECDQVVTEDYRMSGVVLQRAIDLIYKWGCPVIDGFRSKGGWAVDECFLWVVDPNDKQTHTRSLREVQGPVDRSYLSE